MYISDTSLNCVQLDVGTKQPSTVVYSSMLVSREVIESKYRLSAHAAG